MASAPPSPVESPPDGHWEHADLWLAVRNALSSLPSRFESELVVSGVLATDLFAFNSSLAATIEEQVVSSLNRLRSLWDPDQKYALYSFERQSQTFPDVVLRSLSPEVQPRILMGIELKGWYVLAKEKAPSFRYRVTPAACAPADLLVVVPWALSRVVSGSPQVFNPYVVGARYAAELRNHYWQHRRETTGDRSIALSNHSGYYPVKSDMIGDVPAADSSNFGRYARTGAMDVYMADLLSDNLMGIPIKAWQRFLGVFTETRSEQDIDHQLDRLANEFGRPEGGGTTSEEIRLKIAELNTLLNG